MKKAPAILLMVAFLISGCADNNQALVEAVKEGKLESVKSLLANGADINARDERGASALILASGKGSLEVVRLLLDKKADINARNRFGDAALMYASRYR